MACKPVIRQRLSLRPCDGTLLDLAADLNARAADAVLDTFHELGQSVSNLGCLQTQQDRHTTLGASYQDNNLSSKWRKSFRDTTQYVTSETPYKSDNLFGAIVDAILDSEFQMASLNEIYDFVEKNLSDYTRRLPKWKNNVRHILSIHECFVKGPNCGSKSHLWFIDPAVVENFIRGDFSGKGRRKRRRSIKQKTRPKESVKIPMDSFENLSKLCLLQTVIPKTGNTFTSSITRSDSRALDVDDDRTIVDMVDLVSGGKKNEYRQVDRFGHVADHQSQDHQPNSDGGHRRRDQLHRNYTTAEMDVDSYNNYHHHHYPISMTPLYPTYPARHTDTTTPDYFTLSRWSELNSDAEASRDLFTRLEAMTSEHQLPPITGIDTLDHHLPLITGIESPVHPQLPPIISIETTDHPLPPITGVDTADPHLPPISGIDTSEHHFQPVTGIDNDCGSNTPRLEKGAPYYRPWDTKI